MSKLYEAINLLDSAEERTALRIFFTNTEKRTEAESILLTCKDNKEVVAYFKGFLKSGMFPLNCVIFSINTKYLLT